MPAVGRLVTEATIRRRDGRALLVELDNGHQLYARVSARRKTMAATLVEGDRVRVEVPVADPSHGWLLEPVENDESKNVSQTTL